MCQGTQPHLRVHLGLGLAAGQVLSSSLGAPARTPVSPSLGFSQSRHRHRHRRRQPQLEPYVCPPVICASRDLSTIRPLITHHTVEFRSDPHLAVCTVQRDGRDGTDETDQVATPSRNRYPQTAEVPVTRILAVAAATTSTVISGHGSRTPYLRCAELRCTTQRCTASQGPPSRCRGLSGLHDLVGTPVQQVTHAGPRLRAACQRWTVCL